MALRDITGALPASDLDLLRRYEERLNPARPTDGEISVQIIGYGDISAVLRFDALPDLVFKRMAGFRSCAETAAFTAVIDKYCAVLAERGVDVIPTACHTLDTTRNGKVVYLVQPAMAPGSIGNVLLRKAADAEVRALIQAVLQRLNTVLTPNQDPAQLQVGMDAQISNWACVPGDDGACRPIYIDVGAPFMRRNGRELMNFDVLVRAFPHPLRWYFEKFELQDVLNRFYSPTGITIDIAGNFIKEGRADRIPLLLDELETWCAGPAAHLDVSVPTVEQVEKFYDGDARIWTYVLGARKMDRFIRTRLMRGRYDHILPGKIVRR